MLIHILRTFSELLSSPCSSPIAIFFFNISTLIPHLFQEGYDGGLSDWRYDEQASVIAQLMYKLGDIKKHIWLSQQYKMMSHNDANPANKCWLHYLHIN